MKRQEEIKKWVAQAAVKYIQPDTIIGVGSGSTVNYFIEALSPIASQIKGAVAASRHSEDLLKKLGIEVLSANDVSELDVYVDGADEITPHKMMIKGGGAALTREKIVADLAKQFICIVDNSKQVAILGANFPLPIEVIPMARSQVARKLAKMGGSPEYRQGVLTDNGNIIIDVYNFKIMNPTATEKELNNIPGIVSNGIFALRPADLVIVGTAMGIEIID